MPTHAIQDHENSRATADDGLAAYDPAESIGFIVGRLAGAMAHKLNANLAAEGLPVTAEQAALLFRLGMQEGMAQQSLAVCNHKDKAGVTRLIDALERQNLALRIPDAQDRRVKRVYLTPLGKQLRPQILAVLLRTRAEALEGVPADALEAAKHTLRHIFTNLTGRPLDADLLAE